MDTAARDIPFLDADAFLGTDQSKFGTAWRYELVRGAIVIARGGSQGNRVDGG